jgi:hypothetical protein
MNLGALLLLLTLDAQTQAQTASVAALEARKFLAATAGFSAEKLANLDRGNPEGSIFDSRISTEMAPFGAIRVRVPGDYFLRRYRDIADFKKAKEVLKVGKFSSPPRIEDLEGLTLEPGEIDALRKCRPGDCVIKMSDPMIRRLQENVDWKAPDSGSRAMSVYRQLLLEYVKDYLARGRPALMEYHNRKTPIRLQEQSDSILADSTSLKARFPAVARFLDTFPNQPPPNTEQFIYWSKEAFGFKPVVSVTHAVVHSPAPGSIVIASRQLYATHYFIGSLGLAEFAENTPTGAGAYMMYLNRTRVDLLGSFFGPLIRRIVRGRVQEGMERNLRLVKERLETAYGAEPVKAP